MVWYHTVRFAHLRVAGNDLGEVAGAAVNHHGLARRRARLEGRWLHRVFKSKLQFLALASPAG